MLGKLKEFIITLQEEWTYYETVFRTKQSLESSLWGLEEQSQSPENSSQEDQKELNEQIKFNRLKILNCKNILKGLENKISDMIKSYQSTPEAKTTNICPAHQ